MLFPIKKETLTEGTIIDALNDLNSRISAIEAAGTGGGAALSDADRLALEEMKRFSGIPAPVPEAS